MNPDAFSPPVEGCDAFQQEISECADTGAPLASETQAHLRSCAGCRRFAETWFPQGPAVLARPVPAASGGALRARILDAAAQPEVIPFPVAADRRADRSAWLGRIAACLALAGLAWSLLKPVPSQVRAPAVAVAAPTLAQSLAQAEGHTKHEQQVLRTALADGGQRVEVDVAWTLSALE